MFYGDFVSNFFSLDSILFALFDILTLFQGRLFTLSGFFRLEYQNRTVLGEWKVSIGLSTIN
ncbi:hypothetical protein [Leptospira interrogans]|uniref:hypothetical protein n=1 Tax=Leptospira interrogans TaxID=173 RepID=UPI000773C9EE|nr:hypothetical protein [Leptospira interrogans]